MNASVVNHHNKIVRIDGAVWRVIACRLGKTFLIDAECVFGPERGTVVNLKKSRSPLASRLRGALDLNLVS